MTIECPGCFQTLTLKDTARGKRVKCRHCGEAFLADEDLDEVDEVEEVDAAEESPRRSGRKSRKKNPADAWIRLAISWLPALIGLGVLLGMFVAARGSKQVADTLQLVAMGLGALTLLVTYFWALSIAVQHDPAAAIGYALPKRGMRYIVHYSEHMGGPFKLMLIGMGFLLSSVAFLYLHYTPPGGWR